MTETAPVDVDVSFGSDTQSVRMGGYLRDHVRPEAVAEVVTDRTAQNLPPSMDLRAHCTAVEEQRGLGSCTACVVVGAVEHHRKKRNMDPSDLSRLFVYYNARKIRGNTDRDTGAPMEDAMASLLAFGAPRSDLWPYDERERWKEEPPKEAYENAKLNEVVQYARVAPGAGVLATVAAGFPVAVGCFLPKIVYDFAGATGVVPELTAAQWAMPIAGGHAMLIVGYDLIRQTVLVRNSWGPRWGDGGYATIPFSVLEKASPPESHWVVGALEQDGGIMLRAPDTASKADKLREEVRGELGRDLGNVRAGLRDRLTR